MREAIYNILSDCVVNVRNSLDTQKREDQMWNTRTGTIDKTTATIVVQELILVELQLELV